jgi:hypothetical protein
MTKQNRKPAAVPPSADSFPSPRLVFNAQLLPDSAIDENAEGFSVVLDPSTSPVDGFKQHEVMARFTVQTKIRLIDLARSAGKWFLQFDVVDTSGNAAPMYSVEVGGKGAPLTFETAAQLLFGE